MTAKMKRREFITLLGGAAAWPFAARAQPADRVRRLAVLITPYAQTDREGQARVAAFLDTLQRSGWVDGRNQRIEYRWGGGDVDRTRAAAAELVRSTPDLIVSVSNPALAELQRLTSTIPIVFAQVSDPDGSGFVASLARPGANITGFQNFEPAIGGKWLGVLKEAAPNMRRAAVLFGCSSRDQAVVQEARQFGPFSTTIGNLRNRRTAWWAREDSNLQPNHYIRTLAVRMPHIVFQLSPGISSNAGR